MMRKLWMLCLLPLSAACAPGDGDDQVAMDSASIGEMPDSAAVAKDGQYDFLREMSDHHEGLVVMAEQAMSRGSTPEVQQDAHMVHTKQMAERDSMVQLISHHYREQHRPTVMPKNAAQADTLNALQGAQYDSAFYRLVIDHHRDGIGMIDRHVTHLADPQVRAMAERMRTDQEREIQEFQRKSAGSGTQ